MERPLRVTFPTTLDSLAVLEEDLAEELLTLLLLVPLLSPSGVATLEEELLVETEELLRGVETGELLLTEEEEELLLAVEAGELLLTAEEELLLALTEGELVLELLLAAEDDALLLEFWLLVPYEGDEVLAAEEEEREMLLEEPVTPVLLDAEGEELLEGEDEPLVCGAELLTEERGEDVDEDLEGPEEPLVCEYPQTGATSIMDAATAETAIVKMFFIS